MVVPAGEAGVAARTMAARLHRHSGLSFVVAMLLMSGTAAVAATLKDQRLNAAMGLLAFYLVSTGFLTLRRRGRQLRWVEAGAMVFALAVSARDVMVGLEALHSPRGTIDGMPARLPFIFAGVALLAALGDLRVALLGSHPGPGRLFRHLWRMCLAMFIATGSFFLGQPKVFPKALRGGPVLAAPVLLVVVLWIYWMARVLFTRRYRQARAGGSARPA
jgi:hypothetical protein